MVEAKRSFTRAMQKYTFTHLKRWLLVIALAIPIISPINALAAGRSHAGVCSVGASGAHCHAHIVTDDAAHPLASTTFSQGLTPADLHDAYKLPAVPSGEFSWNGQILAIVDANDNPNAAADLLAYRRQFSLPLCPGGTIDCLFTKVNQKGAATPLPAKSVGWGQEIDLDIEIAAATCPSCKILLVESTSATMTNLGIAVDTAVSLGATAVSNSYGGSEFSSEATTNAHYNHPGVAITVSSGDVGYGVEWPAASPYVTAVGGTTLVKNSKVPRGWSETAWSGAGSGCSRYMPRSIWQSPIGTCVRRMVADVSAVADPLSGVAVYDSFGSTSSNNWYVFGGTSVASPIVAGVYALARAANTTTITYAEFPYAHASGLFDVVSGRNGTCSTGLKPLCTAGTGYDGPTGLGTPNGLVGF